MWVGGNLKDEVSKIIIKIKFGGGILGWGMGDSLGAVHCGMSGKCCFVKV